MSRARAIAEQHREMVRKELVEALRAAQRALAMVQACVPDSEGGVTLGTYELDRVNDAHEKTRLALLGQQS